MSCGLKLLMLLSTPFPLRPSAAIRFARHRLPLEALSSAAASHVRLLSVAPSSKLGFSIRAAEQVYTQGVAKEGHSDTVTSSPRFKELYSWPEWSKLADHLLSKGYSQRPVILCDEDDSFSTDDNFSEEFSMAAEACLKFAREQPDILSLLSKKCMEDVVEKGSPYLFKNGEKSVSRMRLFLDGNGSNGLGPEKAQTIDIMRYLLSYMHKSFTTSNGNPFKADESVETSVRKLLLELFDLCGTVWRSKSPEKTATEPPVQNESLSRPRGKSLEMKRGDWICQRCTYLNFARNMSCLECGEARPKKHLTGAEWECPQCDFFNYGRNNSCLRCDCKRPGDPLPSPNPTGGLQHSTSQTILQDSRESSSEILGSDGASDSISSRLDRILGRSSTSSANSSIGKPRRNPDVAPFVPLPPDMFRKAAEPNNGLQNSSNEGIASSSPSTSDLIDTLFKSSKNSTKSNGSKESSAASEPYSDAVSDNDFPDIMPMRKGENRFVVSKKKDRSMTSPAYKRRLAMEQTSIYNTIPFVPFPPDYFAKKDNQAAADSAESASPLTKAETLPEKAGEKKLEYFNQASADFAESASPLTKAETLPEKAGEKKLQDFDQGSADSWNYDGKGAVHSSYDSRNHSTRPDNSKFNEYYSQSRNTTSTNYKPSSTQPLGRYTANSSQPSANTRNNSTSFAAPTENPSQRSRGDESRSKSLEGSCVKETDPLDMSEEAKAERWFRRAAQIKDISELSEIPDEDFPEIMPMRKGVNRFVVSKRKTPLERRLTSPQYRKNLPVVSYEPEKDSSN